MEMNNINNDKLLGTADVAAFLHCNEATARGFMRQKGFPLLKVGKNYRVMQSAFLRFVHSDIQQ